MTISRKRKIPASARSSDAAPIRRVRACVFPSPPRRKKALPELGPTLVLGNKNDLPAAIGVDELIERLGLKSLTNREVCCYSISAKNAVNIDITIDWLTKHSKAAR